MKTQNDGTHRISQNCENSMRVCLVNKIDMPVDYPIWFVDKYIIYSKPEEADDAVSMVLLQWEKIKRDTTPELDRFYEKKHF